MSTLYQLWFIRLYQTSLSSAFPEYKKLPVRKPPVVPGISAEASTQMYVFFGNLRAVFLCTAVLKFAGFCFASYVSEGGVLHRHPVLREDFWNILICSRIHHLLISAPGDVSATYPQPRPGSFWKKNFLFSYIYFVSYSGSGVNQLQSMLMLWNTKAVHQNRKIWGQGCFMNPRIINSSCVLPVATSATWSVLLVCLLVQGLSVCIWIQPYIAKSKSLPLERGLSARWKIHKHKWVSFNS